MSESNMTYKRGDHIVTKDGIYQIVFVDKTHVEVWKNNGYYRYLTSQIKPIETLWSELSETGKQMYRYAQQYEGTPMHTEIILAIQFGYMLAYNKNNERT